ncbi:hypothetical protein PSPO_b0489 [Pseudoalteromonas spongiae UST010723-006]|nr:hypothetical protein PSPO_b0489 [Pseudoalteromonas spongiae UST010723-006]
MSNIFYFELTKTNIIRPEVLYSTLTYSINFKPNTTHNNK